MKNSLSLLTGFGALLLLGSSACAQSSPTPATTTLRTTTRLVVVDVVVSDKKGRPIHGLTAADFTLLETGHPQTLKGLEEHTPGSVAPTQPRPRLPPGTYTNYTFAPSNGANNVLLLDALNTPLEDQAFVRQEMKKYLKTPHPDSRMAIFGLNQQLRLLQGFTSDPEILRSALNSQKGEIKSSSVLENQMSGRQNSFGTEDNTTADFIDSQSDNLNAEMVVANYMQFQAERVAFQLQLRTRITLEALNVLGRYLGGIPGRKNLIWFSGSFPLNVLPDGNLRFPFATAFSMEDEFRDTANLLARNQVAVYPIDARGLLGTPMIDASDTGEAYGTGPQNAGIPQAHQESFLEQTTSSQTTMLLMAENTGGKAFVNTNNLNDAVARAIDAGSNYYTLTYAPSNRDWHGDYRKLEVKLARQGYTLSYRRGYYADDPDASAGGRTSAAARAATPYDPMHGVMLMGGPDPTEIIFSASVRPTTGQSEPDIAPSNHAESRASGPFKRYTITLHADPAGISALPIAAGGRHLDLGVLTYAYTDKGKLVTSVGSRVALDITEQRYQSILANGLAYTQEISVPVKGQYFLRVGLHDRASDHVGALEVPIDIVSRLKPATP